MSFAVESSGRGVYARSPAKGTGLQWLTATSRDETRCRYRISSLIRGEPAKNAGRIDAFLSRIETYGSETAQEKRRGPGWPWAG